MTLSLLLFYLIKVFFIPFELLKTSSADRTMMDESKKVQGN